MNKKIAIVTMHSVDNYGNRLQNYAMQTILQKQGFDVESIAFKKAGFKDNVREIIKNTILLTCPFVISKDKRLNWIKYKRFIEFTQNNITTAYFDQNIDNDELSSKYDFFVTGSDQVWNPTWYSFVDGKFSPAFSRFFLTFARREQRVSISPSIGISEIPGEYTDEFTECLNGFPMLSVREDTGGRIIKELTGRDAQVLVDPTMLLDKEDWRKIAKRPNCLQQEKQVPFLLTCFLGSISSERRAKLEEVARENDLKIINLLDKDSPEAFVTTPDEFVSLVDNSALVCTDSFHALVFSMLFEKPFIAFEREEPGNCVMSSRLETLLGKFKMTDRRENSVFAADTMKIDYSNVNVILQSERNKFFEYMKKAFDVPSAKEQSN